MLTFADFIRNMSEPVPNMGPIINSATYVDVEGRVHVQLRGVQEHQELRYKVSADEYRWSVKRRTA